MKLVLKINCSYCDFCNITIGEKNEKKYFIGIRSCRLLIQC